MGQQIGRREIGIVNTYYRWESTGGPLFLGPRTFDA